MIHDLRAVANAPDSVAWKDNARVALLWAANLIDAAVAVREECDALRQDAERLDWLLPKIRGAQYRDIGVHYGSGDDIRAAIDAARSQDGKA